MDIEMIILLKENNLKKLAFYGKIIKLWQNL